MDIWQGFLDAYVWRKVKENAYIDSFYIKVKEADILPSFLPGQYIGIRVPKETGETSKARLYTISSMPNGEYYRVSIKREENGEISKLLCDEVKEGDRIQITAPKGKFVLHEGSCPVALIGGGIGITPMLTMAMETAKTERATHLIYGLPNSDFMAFREEINNIIVSNQQMKATIGYSRPLPHDVKGKDYDYEGRFTKEWLEKNIDRHSDIYICGPVGFMRTIYQGLIQSGWKEENIYYEMFEPGVDIRQ